MSLQTIDCKFFIYLDSVFFKHILSIYDFTRFGSGVYPVQLMCVSTQDPVQDDNFVIVVRDVRTILEALGLFINYYR